MAEAADGRRVTLYGHCTAPFGVRGKIGADHGQTWDEELVVYDETFVVYQEGFTWDLGDPTSVELPDNRMPTIRYQTMEGEHHAVLRQAIWTLPAR